MKLAAFACALLILFAGCETQPGGAAPGPGPSRPGSVGQVKSGSNAKPGPTLREARQGFTPKPARPLLSDPPSEPPAGVFRLVKYESPAGQLAAFLSPDPGDGNKHPAIVWITGGDCNSVDEVWKPGPRKNEQTATAYREAGIIMMFPSLRGGSGNPGQREGFYGEVDDVLAAADFLSRQPYVDPKRIYLGGHSTGGALVMLVAEMSDRFRAVFSFGPADNVAGYDPRILPADTSDPRELALRSPGRWLSSVESPLFVLEGTNQPANIDALQGMARSSKNPNIHFLAVPGLSHFSILAPANELIAAKILRDDGPETNIAFSDEEIRQLQSK